MARQTLEKTSTDWFDLVKLQLDELREECLQTEDKSSVPTDSKFESVKETIGNLRILAEFPILPEANIWLGPNGEIGVTWRFTRAALELLFAKELYVRLHDSKEQLRVQLSDVPSLMKKLSKGAK